MNIIYKIYRILNLYILIVSIYIILFINVKELNKELNYLDFPILLFIVNNFKYTIKT